MTDNYLCLISIYKEVDSEDYPIYGASFDVLPFTRHTSLCVVKAYSLDALLKLLIYDEKVVDYVTIDEEQLTMWIKGITEFPAFFAFNSKGRVYDFSP